MNILDMLQDYCRRAPRKLTVLQLLEIIKNNHILVDDGCFVVFATAFDEVRILCPYAPKGKSIVPLERKLADLAKERGFKRLSLITDRPEAVGRKFPDYKPVGTLFEKRLD